MIINFKKTECLLTGSLLPIISVFFVLVGLVMGIRFYTKDLGYKFDPATFLVKAEDWLKSHIQDGKMFNTFIWGGYIQYRLWPEERGFFDSKSHLYGEGFVQKYIKTLQAEKVGILLFINTIYLGQSCRQKRQYLMLFKKNKIGKLYTKMIQTSVCVSRDITSCIRL